LTWILINGKLEIPDIHVHNWGLNEKLK